MSANGSLQQSQEEAERRVAEAFNAYFGNFDIRIAPEDVAVGNRRTIPQGRMGDHLSHRPRRRCDADPGVLRNAPHDQRPACSHFFGWAARSS